MANGAFEDVCSSMTGSTVIFRPDVNSRSSRLAGQARMVSRPGFQHGRRIVEAGKASGATVKQMVGKSRDTG